jgi:hypothetical protein
MEKGTPMITAYFGFSPPAAWATVEPRPMTMGKPRYELPRAKPGDPVVALKEGFVHARGPDGGEDAGTAPASDPFVEVLAGWQKRLGAITPSRRAQPLALHGPGAIERVGEVPVLFVEQVAKGRAFLGAAVDLSSVDARTRSAYVRVSALTFELEGPAATVLAAKADFEALVRSVHLTK